MVISDISNGLFVLRDHAATLAQNAGRIAFAGTAAQVAETGVDARVIVRRNGGTAGAVSVDYATSDLAAIAGNDYTATTGTLNWASGDMSDRTIAIPITNDTEIEPDEAFRVTLSNAAGGATLEGSATIDVEIERQRCHRQSAARRWGRRRRPGFAVAGPSRAAVVRRRSWPPGDTTQGGLARAFERASQA